MLRLFAQGLWSRSTVAVALLAGGFALLADEVSEGETQRFDDAVLAMLRAGDRPGPIGPSWFIEAARDVTALGSFAVLGGLVAIVCLYLVMAKRGRTARFLFISAVAGTICSTLLKLGFNRPRPGLPDTIEVFTASFPSGHALLSAVCYLTIGALLAEQADNARLRRFFIGVAAVITLLVGMSRVYLGVHYPTDVAAGWLIGTGWAIGSFIIARLRRQQRALRNERST